MGACCFKPSVSEEYGGGGVSGGVKGTPVHGQLGYGGGVGGLQTVQTHTNTHTHTHTTAAEKRAKELEEELARTKKAADEAKKKAEEEAKKREEEAEARAKEKAAADAKVVILASISQFVCVLSKSTVWFWGMEIIQGNNRSWKTILKFFPVSL